MSLASRYITDRALPDSALDLIDDAGAEVELRASAAKKAGAENPTRALVRCQERNLLFLNPGERPLWVGTRLSRAEPHRRAQSGVACL